MEASLSEMTELVPMLYCRWLTDVNASYPLCYFKSFKFLNFDEFTFLLEYPLQKLLFPQSPLTNNHVY